MTFAFALTSFRGASPIGAEGEDERCRFRLDGVDIGDEGVPGTNEGLFA